MLKINRTDSKEEYAFVLEKGAVANTEVTVGLIRVYLCVYLANVLIRFTLQVLLLNAPAAEIFFQILLPNFDFTLIYCMTLKMFVNLGFQLLLL